MNSSSQNKRILSSSFTSSSAPPKGIDPETDFYLKCSSSSLSTILDIYQTSSSGLPFEAIPAIRLQAGSNILEEKDQCPGLHLFFNAAINPFNALLSMLAIIIYCSGEESGCIIVLSMVFLSIFTTFIQEYRSSNAVKKLQQLITSNITLIRLKQKDSLFLPLDKKPIKKLQTSIRARINPSSGKYIFKYDDCLSIEQWSYYEPAILKLPTKELVPGDIILLSAGDMIPADIRLIESKLIQINQSSMTGESMAVEKNAAWVFTKEHPIFDYPNLIFQGTSVVSGSAKGLVISTGKNTVFGKMKKTLSKPREKTAFEKGINNYVCMMVGFMIGLGVLTFFVNIYEKDADWTDALEFSMAVAVGLTPEMLPMIVTVNLAKGAIEMSKKDVIVKKLNAIQNFGAMDVLCIDKTGTLTEDKIVVGKSYDFKGGESLYSLELAYYISVLQTGLKNFLDDAIIEKVDEKNQYIQKKLIDVKKIDEIPFDFDRRCMSVIVEQASNKVLLCKGAPEEILQRSVSFVESRFSPVYEENQMIISDHFESFNSEKKLEIQNNIKNFNKQGFRVIGVAYKSLINEEKTYSNSDMYRPSDEQNMVFVGFLTFYDPPKPTAAELIKKLNDNGLSVKVLTGDNPYVAQYICQQVGIKVDSLLLGQDLADLTPEILEEKVESLSLFAKLTPVQKQQIVKILQKKGHVVGFMGDGINDSLALKVADCSISVDNAVDITKQCAEIILLKKDLKVLIDGIEEGRKTFGNIVKYIKMSAASNFGNVFSIAGAGFLFSFLPMTAVQLLIETLLYDFSQCGIPFDNVDAEYMEKPRKWEIMDIAKFMLTIGPISSIFDYSTWGTMWWYFGNHGDTTDDVTQFQTAWFIEGLMTQTLIVHIIRTHKIPFIESRASCVLITTTCCIMGVCLSLPYTTLAEYVPFIPPPAFFYVFLVTFLMGYVILAQIGKHFFYKYNGLK